MAVPDTVRPEEAPAPPAPAAPDSHRRLRWASYVRGALVLASLVVAAPLALGSIGRQLVAPPENDVYTFSPGRAAGAASPPADASYLNIAITGLDEVKKVATLRLSGHRACRTECPAFTLRLFSLSDRAGQRAGLPPSVAVNAAAGTQVLSEVVELPVSGLPSLYPFDRYTLRLSNTVTSADAAPSAALMPALYDGSLTITLESALARLLMLPPEVQPARSPDATAEHPAFRQVVSLRFVRPLHLQVLTCLLVALVAAAALLSVSTEPVRRLLVGVGSVVLSVWGVRQS